MNRSFKLFFLGVVFIGVSLSPAFAFDGPLQVKNQYPIFLHAGQPYLEKASMENSFSLSLSHSSTYTVQTSRNWVINLDMEITELNLRYKRIIKDFAEFGMDVPLISFNAGFMDGFLESYHDAFGFPDYGRKNRPNNDFLYEVRKNGALVIRGDTGVGLGDVRFALKKPVISSDGFNLAVRGDIEVPTGSAKKGYGNGNLDFAGGLLLDISLSKKIMAYLNFGGVFPGDVKGYQKIGLNDFVYGGLALEATVEKNCTLIAQVQGQSSIYPATDLIAVDREAYLLVLGGRYATKKHGIELSLSEDISTSGAPDFIINLTYKMKL